MKAHLDGVVFIALSCVNSCPTLLDNNGGRQR